MKTEENKPASTNDIEKTYHKLRRRYSDIKAPNHIVKRTREGLYLPACGKAESQSVLVEWSRIDEPLKALQTARRLAHKLWASREMIADFLDLTFAHFKWAKGFPYL